jgi:sulfite reductase beta subunit-like hemoprotein
MTEITVDLEVIEKRAEEIDENTPFTTEQSRVIACRTCGLSHAETAEMLDKSKGTVRSTWYTCRKKWSKIVWARHHMTPDDFGFESDSEALESLRD